MSAEDVRNKLINRMGYGIKTLLKSHPDAKELNQAKQGLQFLMLNRISRIETLRHLAILLDSRAFSMEQIGDNSTLLLKFVKMTEKVQQEVNRIRKLQ